MSGRRVGSRALLCRRHSGVMAAKWRRSWRQSGGMAARRHGGKAGGKAGVTVCTQWGANLPIRIFFLRQPVARRALLGVHVLRSLHVCAQWGVRAGPPLRRQGRRPPRTRLTDLAAQLPHDDVHHLVIPLGVHVPGVVRHVEPLLLDDRGDAEVLRRERGDAVVALVVVQ
eukprot:gene8475-biopygen6316